MPEQDVTSFFERAIVSRKRDVRLYEYRLECEHTILSMVPIKSAKHYCAQCLHDWIDQQKAAARLKD